MSTGLSVTGSPMHGAANTPPYTFGIILDPPPPFSCTNFLPQWVGCDGGPDILLLHHYPPTERDGGNDDHDDDDDDDDDDDKVLLCFKFKSRKYIMYL